ncbi:hypothetical protein NtRootA9_09900 [Arthrobacter sp. NtRootA9]|nr:hypothetical protein NtRootA9_09900 [Arthrobacter sp. NtRootA9]
MNASAPSFVSVFATSGSTGTGTFWAGPDASAGLYTALGVGEGEAEGLGDADAVAEAGDVPGSAGAPPEHPASTTAPATARAAAAGRRPKDIRTLCEIMGRYSPSSDDGLLRAVT